MASGFIPPTPQSTPEKAADPSGSPAVLKLTLPEQKSDVDSNLLFDVQKLAFEQVAVIGATIRARIEVVIAKEKAVGVQVVYLDRMLRGGLDLLGATSSQVINLKQAFDNAAQVAQEGLDHFAKLRPPATDSGGKAIQQATAQAAGAIAPFSLTGAQSALNLLGLLATESHYFGRKVTIEEEPFLLEISSQLRQIPNVTIYHPALFTPWSKKASFDMPAAIKSAMDELLSSRSKALRPVNRLMAISAALKPDDPLYQEMRFVSDQARQQYESADALLRELNTRLSQKDDTIGATGFQMLVRAAAMVDIFNMPGTTTYLLFARMEVAGGAYRVVRSLARLVLGGDGIDYSAGVIASFGLFGLDGKLLDSGILTTRRSFRPVAEPVSQSDQLVPILLLLLLVAVALLWFFKK